MKNTLILGASPNPERYAYKATLMLSKKGHNVFPVGLRSGKIGSHNILTDKPIIENIDTVTLYIGPQRQPEYYEYILKKIKPKRIIFNPGTENNDFISLAQENEIKTEIACTLVLLSLKSY
jgi:predicted CoA-binding protein